MNKIEAKLNFLKRLFKGYRGASSLYGQPIFSQAYFLFEQTKFLKIFSFHEPKMILIKASLDHR
jgi:hypothetical protein